LNKVLEGDTMYKPAVTICVVFVCTAAMAQPPEVPEGMVLIPATEFQMGISEAELEELAELGCDVPHMNLGHAQWWFGGETPVHTVFLDSFYMDVFEVTNTGFREFVEETGYTSFGNWERFATEGFEQYPVVGVTWHDAEAYAEWAGKRLPTEAEWEYACAGGTDRMLFFWGNEPDPGMANYRYQGESFLAGVGRLVGFRNLGTSEVGSYPANGYGLFDMLGNVSEWVNGEYRPYPGFSEELGFWNTESPDYSRKVFRGGSWETPNAVFLRTTTRFGSRENSYRWDLGFRCAADIRSVKLFCKPASAAALFWK
jgi:formylglycine-generating enzyme required for sulfatase activity